jgi:hypothetical protein
VNIPRASFPAIQTSSYHSGPFLLGRNTGSMALEPEPRAPSKKQAKRKRRLIVRNDQKRDPKKDKLKSKHMKSQIQSDELKNFTAELTEQ